MVIGLDFTAEDIQTILRLKKFCRYDILKTLPRRKEENHEKDSDDFHEKFEGDSKEGWLRRVSDVLPVCVQDIVHGWKPELRAQIIYIAVIN